MLLVGTHLWHTPLTPACMRVCSLVTDLCQYLLHHEGVNGMTRYDLERHSTPATANWVTNADCLVLT